MNPLAVRVMAEAGVDISRQCSTHVDDLVGIDFDQVITVCDDAAELCPTFPRHTEVVHQPFEDPPKLAECAGSGFVPILVETAQAPIVTF